MKMKLFANLLLCFGLNSLLMGETNTPAVDSRMCGVCYGPFREGQGPDKNVFPSKEEIEADIVFLATKTKSIRTYNTGKAMESIPSMCDKAEIGLYVGIWIGKDKDANSNEVERGISIALEKHKSIKGLIVGSEALLRKDLSVTELISYIREVKAKTGLPVTTAEVADCYLKNPELIESIDFLFLHVYPYWAGVSIENGCAYTFGVYDSLVQKFPSKEIIIGETGWPTEGNQIGKAISSNENQATYFMEFTCMADANKVSYYYFEAFDESWKENHEGKVGAHWGIWDSSGMSKIGIKELITTNGPPDIARPGYQAPPLKPNGLDSGLPF